MSMASMAGLTATLLLAFSTTVPDTPKPSATASQSASLPNDTSEAPFVFELTNAVWICNSCDLSVTGLGHKPATLSHHEPPTLSRLPDQQVQTRYDELMREISAISTRRRATYEKNEAKPGDPLRSRLDEAAAILAEINRRHLLTPEQYRGEKAALLAAALSQPATGLSVALLPSSADAIASTEPTRPGVVAAKGGLALGFLEGGDERSKTVTPGYPVQIKERFVRALSHDLPDDKKVYTLERKIGPEKLLNASILNPVVTHIIVANGHLTNQDFDWAVNIQQGFREDVKLSLSASLHEYENEEARKRGVESGVAESVPVPVSEMTLKPPTSKYDEYLTQVKRWWKDSFGLLGGPAAALLACLNLYDRLRRRGEHGGRKNEEDDADDDGDDDSTTQE